MTARTLDRKPVSLASAFALRLAIGAWALTLWHIAVTAWSFIR